MSTKRILIVEDSESMAELYKEYLLGAGYQVDIVGDGKSALGYLGRDLPDAIVLDMHIFLELIIIFLTFILVCNCQNLLCIFRVIRTPPLQMICHYYHGEKKM